AGGERGGSMLCGSMGTLSQFFFDIANAPRFSKLQTPYLRAAVIEWPRWNVSPELLMRRAWPVQIVSCTSHIYTDCRQHWRSCTMKRLILVLLTGAAFAASFPAYAAVKTIVLVHGAFADGSGWKPVADILQSHGYSVRVVQ